jgi:hypothetical protein
MTVTDLPAQVEPSVLDQIHALEVLGTRLAEERDRHKTRADLAEAAGVEMAQVIAFGIRREEALEFRNAALEERHERVRDAFRQLLDEKHQEIRRLSDHNVLLVAETGRLQTELAAAQEQRTSRWRRSPST